MMLKGISSDRNSRDKQEDLFLRIPASSDMWLWETGPQHVHELLLAGFLNSGRIWARRSLSGGGSQGVKRQC